MFERYAQNARRVIFHAREEAMLYGSPYIESEHLLLGILRENESLAKSNCWGDGLCQIISARN
jgi:ATP-dependent Clp protease ATP-binding subunit ClpC